jgi:hypothetical protein
MKKIILAISALSAALFSTAANADISISGSANVVYADAGGNSEAHIGGAVSFALSTVTDSGVTISSSAAITNDNDAAGSSPAASGLSSVTFGFSNGSITFADDVTLPTGKGLVGELVSHADSNQVGHTNDVELDGFDDGSGVAASMPLGDMTLNAVYVYDAGSSTAYTHGSDIDGATGTGQGVSLTVPMGDMSLVVATASNDDAGTESSTFGGSLTVPAGSGTLVVGLESSSNDQATNEGEAYSVKYTTSFDAVSLSVGYTGYDANSNTSSRTDLVASTSLGGGASLFAEFSSLTGAGAAAETNSTSESTIAVGTSISF